MKKITSALLVSISLFLSGCSLTNETTTTALTSATENTTIEVYTVEDLQAIEPTNNVELMADLDLSGLEWEPLCSYDAPYSGVFNGNFHTISNMTITESNTDYNGLFTIVTGEIHDLNITDIDIDYTTSFVTYAGGLAGSSTAKIDNVSVSGSISVINASTTSYVGLLLGLSTAYITAEMTADEFVQNTISNSDTSGDIYVNSEFFAYVGGLIGKSYNSEIINNSTDVTLNVTVEKYRAYVGGLIGHHYGGILIGYEAYVDTTSILVQNNVSISNILVTSNGTYASIGALIGYVQYGKIYDNFALSDITASGSALNIGSLIGEDWYSTIDSTVSVTTFTIFEEDNQVLLLSTITGFNNDATVIDNSYYYVISNITYDQNLGDPVSLDTLNSDEFYISTLGWDDTIFDISLLEGFLPIE